MDMLNKEKEQIQVSDSDFDVAVFDHSGHRARLKAFYAANGMDVMKDYEILEMILFYAIPRKDTRVIARRLLNQFGTIGDVMDADIKELIRVSGLSENGAMLLKMIPDAARAYMLSKKEKKPCLTTTEEQIAYLSDYFVGRTNECFYLLCLDSAGRLLRCRKLAEGEPNKVHVNVKKVSLEIVDSSASCVIIAHNHPQGLALPSHNDVETTKKIAAIVAELGMALLDHIIFSPTETFSMANSNRFYSCFFQP